MYEICQKGKSLKLFNSRITIVSSSVVYLQRYKLEIWDMVDTTPKMTAIKMRT